MESRQQELELALLNGHPSEADPELGEVEQPPEKKIELPEITEADLRSQPNGAIELTSLRLYGDTRLEDLQEQRKELNKKWWKFFGLELIAAAGGVVSIVGTVFLCKYFKNIQDLHTNECKQSHPDGACNSSDVDKGEGLGFAGSIIGGVFSSCGFFGYTFFAHSKKCEFGEKVAEIDQAIEANKEYRGCL
jgi:hypothetical protein